MQIVIDIPEGNYKRLMEYDGVIDDFWLEAIKNGTPLNDLLDKICAEIEQTAKDYDKFNDHRRVRGLWIALDIIDRHMKGVSE